MLDFTAEKMLPLVLDHLTALSGAPSSTGTIPSSSLSGLLPHALSIKEKLRDLKQKYRKSEEAAAANEALYQDELMAKNKLQILREQLNKEKLKLENTRDSQSKQIT